MATETSVSFGAFRLDPQNACIWRGAEMIKLTPKAFAVLHYLVSHPGRLITKDELFTAVWPKTVVSDVALSVCVREIRKSLEDDAKTPQYIETVHRQGFRFIATVTAAPVPSSEFKVPSQEEVASSQYSVFSREDSQLSSLDEVQRNPGEEEESLSRIALRSIRSTESVSTRLWPSRKLAWLGVVLFVSTGVFLLYFSSFRIPHSTTRNQGEGTSLLPLPDRPSIVVLPFTNLSGDLSQEYFSDGLTAEITNTLSRVASLFVIARTSAFTYKGKAVKVQDISRELGVHYVLEGSVRKTNDQLRILAQLIDGTTGGQLWAESYERPLKDIFAIQDEIVQKIGTTLKLQFPLWEYGLPIRKRTNNMEAYDYFLRGLDYCCRFTKEANAQGRQMLERATELDPQYAEAYAMLGWTYFAEWIYQWNLDPQNLERALALEQKALALDDSLTWGHRTLSEVYLYKRQYEQSIAEAERAIALGPNEADNYSQLTESFVLAGQPERAIGYGKQALRLNPRTISFAYMTLGWSYRLVGRHEEAIVLLKKFLGQYPNHLGAHLNLATAYQESGREEEARTEVAQVLRLNPNYSLETLKKMNLQKDPALAERSYAALRKAGLK